MLEQGDQLVSIKGLSWCRSQEAGRTSCAIPAPGASQKPPLVRCAPGPAATMQPQDTARPDSALGAIEYNCSITGPMEGSLLLRAEQGGVKSAAATAASAALGGWLVGEQPASAPHEVMAPRIACNPTQLVPTCCGNTEPCCCCCSQRCHPPSLLAALLPLAMAGSTAARPGTYNSPKSSRTASQSGVALAGSPCHPPPRHQRRSLCACSCKKHKRRGTAKKNAHTVRIQASKTALACTSVHQILIPGVGSR
jgi:hypothetical protein